MRAVIGYGEHRQRGPCGKSQPRRRSAVMRRAHSGSMIDERSRTLFTGKQVPMKLVQGSKKHPAPTGQNPSARGNAPGNSDMNFMGTGATRQAGAWRSREMRSTTACPQVSWHGLPSGFMGPALRFHRFHGACPQVSWEIVSLIMATCVHQPQRGKTRQPGATPRRTAVPKISSPNGAKPVSPGQRPGER